MFFHHTMSALSAFLAENLPLTPLAINIGIICLVSQLTLTVLFHGRQKILPPGPWSDLPAFTAHQVVAFALMIVLTYNGWKDWNIFSLQHSVAINSDLTAHDRIHGFSREDDVFLAIGTGAILIWDIPTSAVVPSLRDPLMLIHHIGMFLVAAVMGGLFSENGQMIGYYYVPFYFGVIETSSIFLSVVDQFHPKRKQWYEWLNKEYANEKTMALVNRVKQVNDISRVLFAASFLLFRALYFPYLSFAHTIPDILEVCHSGSDGIPSWAYYFLCAAIFLFSFLQIYWGLLVCRQVNKALCASKKPQSQNGKKNN